MSTRIVGETGQPSWRSVQGQAAVAPVTGRADDPPDGGDDGQGSGDGFVPEDQELPRVMREIVQAMGGHGAALTLHPEDERPPRLLYADAAVPAPFVKRLLACDALWPKIDPGNLHAWKECGALAPLSDVFVMPVQRVRGHSRLVISVFFHNPTKAERERAEAVYLARRPFAVGYFRLWQEDRANRKMATVLKVALDLTATGIVLLNGDGEAVFANIAARDLMEKGGGLRERHGRIMAGSLRDSARLQAAIDHVLLGEDPKARHVRAPMLAIRRDGKPALIVSIFPAMQEAEEARDVAAILFAVDPTLDVEQQLEPVCKLFQLSPVETHLACLLATGATLQEAAAKLKLKEPTARSYLKQVFIKTGSNRQASLMRIMLSSLVRTTREVTFDVM